jgi:hypothetical protein
MVVDDGIDVFNVRAQRLGAEIGGSIDQNVVISVADQDGRAQSVISRIG